MDIKVSKGARDRILDHSDIDALSRERWSKMLAAIMSQLALPIVYLIVDGGQDKFIRVVTPILEGHQFKEADLKRIYRILKRTKELNKKFQAKDVLYTA